MKGEIIITIYGESTKWKNRLSEEDPKVCPNCYLEHGHIFPISKSDSDILLSAWHPHCRCWVEKVKTILHGSATQNGNNGADFYLYKFNSPPNYYITMQQAAAYGWHKGDDLSKIVPNKMISKGIYRNFNNHLPTNKIWYEADINYAGGKRNSDRILYSNDGLIFVTFDHYKRFYEIV